MFNNHLKFIPTDQFVFYFYNIFEGIHGILDFGFSTSAIKCLRTKGEIPGCFFVESAEFVYDHNSLLSRFGGS